MCVLATDATVHLLVTLTGLYLIFAGVSAILWLVYQPRTGGRRRADPAALARRRGAGEADRRRARRPAHRRHRGFVRQLGRNDDRPPAPGHVQRPRALCDRPLTEVALPATHNSMSVPLPGWFSAMQERPIADQLPDGIRGLLIDTHYADRLPNGRCAPTSASKEELQRRAQRTTA